MLNGNTCIRKKGCATFAYFSVTVNGSGSTTTVTATTGKVGTVTVSGSQGPFNLVVTAQDMIAQSADKNYYAINDETGNEGTETGGKWASTPKTHTVGTIKLENAGANDTVKCSVSVQADLSGTMVEKLQEGDVFLTLSGLDDLFSGVEAVDLSKDTASEGKFTFVGDGVSKTGTATFTGAGQLSLTASESSKELKADVYLVNKKLTEQNDLADKSLTVKLTLQVTECATTSTAGD